MNGCGRGILLALLLALLTAGCSQAKPVKIAINEWIGYQTLPIALSMNLIDSENMRIMPVTSASHTMNLIRDGVADAAAMTLDEAITLVAEGIDLAVIMPLDISAGADVVLSSHPLDELKQLERISIAYEQTSVGSLMFARMVALSGMDAAKFDKINVPADQLLTYWQQHHPDMMISYEPIASQLIAAGAVRFMDSRQIPNSVVDVLVVRRDRLQACEPRLKTIIRGQLAAVAFSQLQTGEFNYRVAGLTGLSSSSVAAMLRGIILPNATYSRNLMVGEPPRLEQAASALAQLMRQQGLITREIDGRDLIDSALLLEVTHNDQP